MSDTKLFRRTKYKDLLKKVTIFSSLAAQIGFKIKFDMRLQEKLEFTNVTVDNDGRNS